MADAPAIIAAPKSREEWLLARRNYLTASDAWRILLDRGAFAVYASKVGGYEQDETAPMRWGRKAESLVAEAYAEETGRPALDLGGTAIQIHPDIPWLACTLDRLTESSREAPAPPEVLPGALAPVPLECKVVGGHNAQLWHEEPPVEYVIQLQIQMAVMGSPWGCLAAMFGWPPKPEHVDRLRDDRFLKVALPKLEAFWMRVQRREPPVPDAEEATSAAIRALWSEPDGETIDLDVEALALMDDLERERDQERAWSAAAKKRIHVLENLLRVRMKTATWGRLPDRSAITLKKVTNAGYTVAPFSYRRLGRWRPKLKLRR